VLFYYRLAALKPRDFLRAWLRHLARNLVEKGETQIFGFEEEVTRHRFLGLDPKTAGDLLGDLLSIYWRGLSEPLRFFPKSSWNFVNAVAQGDIANARGAANTGWFGNKQSERGGDRHDPFIALAFRGEEDPRTSEWEEISRAILEPLIRRLETIEE